MHYSTPPFKFSLILKTKGASLSTKVIFTTGYNKGLAGGGGRTPLAYPENINFERLMLFLPPLLQGVLLRGGGRKPKKQQILRLRISTKSHYI